MSETSFDTDKAEWREELAAGRRRTAEPTQNLEEVRTNHCTLDIYSTTCLKRSFHSPVEILNFNDVLA